MRTETAISTRIWLAGALSLGLAAGTVIGILAFELKAAGASYEYSPQDRQEGARYEDTERLLHGALNKQFQEWKKIAFHGYHTVDVAKYSDQFRAASSNLGEMGFALQASVIDPAVRQVTEEFLRTQSALRNKCEVALRISAETIARNTHEADQPVKGQGRTLTDRMFEGQEVATRRALRRQAQF